MPLGTCKLCRKMFTPESGKVGSKICPNCREKLDSLYTEVRNYLRDHSKEEFNVEAVAEELQADIRYVQELVDLGYLDRDLPERADAASYDPDKQRLVKAFEASIDKLKASAAAQAAYKPVTYGQEIYGDKSKKR